MTTLTGHLSAPTRPLAEAEDVRPTRRRLGPGEPIRFGGLIGIGLPASVVSSPALMRVFVAAGALGMCAAVITRLLHRPGHLVSRLPR